MLGAAGEGSHCLSEARTGAYRAGTARLPAGPGRGSLPPPAAPAEGAQRCLPPARAEVGALRDLRRERDAVPSLGAVPEALSSGRELEPWPSI